MAKQNYMLLQCIPFRDDCQLKVNTQADKQTLSKQEMIRNIPSKIIYKFTIKACLAEMQSPFCKISYTFYVLKTIDFYYRMKIATKT